MIEKLVIEKNVVTVRERIKANKAPVFLWGMGAHARQVVRFCKTYGIEIKGVFTDTYCEEKEWMNLPVMKIADIKMQYPEFSVIIGHSSYYKADFFKQEHGISHVYCITNVAYGKYDRLQPEFIEKYDAQYTQTYNWLCDDESKRNMEAYLNARINDDSSYTIRQYKKGMTYFENDVIKLKENETLVDAGAFNGDTISAFIAACDGKYNKILGLEADKENYKILKKFVIQNSIKNVSVTDIGAWSYKTQLHFDAKDEQGSAINSTECISGSVINVDTIDNICKMFDVNDISFIKFNYYQGLVESLQGCKHIILAMKPKLAIRAGYDENQLIQLPQLLKQICPSYKLYFRYCLPIPVGLTLFAI